MCGIGSITTTKNASPSTLARLDAAAGILLLALDHRGGDACGILTIRADGRCHTIKAPTDAPRFNAGRGQIPAGTRAVAVHTRFATSGEPHWNRNNHPVACEGALVLHNGVIYDHRTPATIQHPEPEVDTYLLAQAAASAATRRKGETVQQHAERVALAMAQEDGSAAVLVAFKGTPTLIAAALSDSPLYHAEAEGVRITASTREAVQRTFAALNITLPIVPYSYEKTIRKAKKGRPAVKQTVQSSREAITYALSGEVMTWHAGTHTAGRIAIPERYHGARTWQSSGLKSLTPGSYVTPKGDDHWDNFYGDNYKQIAERLLNADLERCDICDDWTDATDLKLAFGGHICSECLAEIQADEDDYANTKKESN